MLIVSKFHDFYDTASIYGIDKTCVYNRKEESVKIERPYWHSKNSVSLPNGNRFELYRTGGSDNGFPMGWDVNRILIGFCGKFYPVVSIKINTLKEVNKKFFFYNAKDFNAFMDIRQITSSKKSYYSPTYNKYNLDHSKGVEAFFDGIEEMNIKYQELFHAFKSPVFAIHGLKIILNPSLKSYGFMKQKDPQTSFQDIYMFLSGVLGSPPPKKEKIDDKIMAASKGHDGPYSFKKTPGKRGKNKWR